MGNRMLGALGASTAMFMMIAGVAIAGDANDAELVAMEKALWQAWADADTAPFEQHLADVSVNMTPGGVTIGKAKNVQMIADAECKVNSFSFGDFTVLRPTSTVALVVYTASQDATCDGHAVPPRINATGVWVKDGNAWKSAAYTEVPVAE